MREREIERRLSAEVRARGGMSLKFVSPGLAGVPDRLVLLPGGKICYAELKAPGEKPRRLQLLRHDQLRALGFRVFVIDQKDQIGECLDEICSL